MSLQPQPTLVQPLQRTALHAVHAALGARFVPFAGYEMPIQFPSGILKEHLHTRAAAGLFDVSHMGQLVVRPRLGDMADAAHALEKLIPIDLLGLGAGRQRYALLTNSAGGILDDLMVASLGDRFMLIVNASRKEDDEAHLRASLSESCIVERLDMRALIALQGPLAQAVLAHLCPPVASLGFMDVARVAIAGVQCVVSRSGYTGEDGFEISIPAEQAESIARKLLEDSRVRPIGLGARDSLRLEAGLCLYGADLDITTTPIDAGLAWVIQKSRREGVRAGGFPGADVIFRQLAAGPARRRVGLRSRERTPVRGGSALYSSAAAPTPVGHVTSGGFGPTVNAPVAMGYVASSAAAVGTLVFADVRDKRVPVEVSELPFVEPRYKRQQ
jgi:aminomethyltransferase